MLTQIFLDHHSCPHYYFMIWLEINSVEMMEGKWQVNCSHRVRKQGLVWQLKGLEEAKRDLKGIWYCKVLQLDCVLILPTMVGKGHFNCITSVGSIHIEFDVNGADSLALSQSGHSSNLVMMGFGITTFPYWLSPFTYLVADSRSSVSLAA